MGRIRFGDFTLDLDNFDLRRDGQQIRLERRPLDLLVLLVRQPGRLVTRDEIVATLWPRGVIIDFDAGLNTLVRKVRTALGDSTEQPRFIETVPGRGYRFVATVEVEASSGTREPLVAASTTAATPAPSPAPAAASALVHASETHGIESLELRTPRTHATIARGRRAWLAAAVALLAVVAAAAVWSRFSQPAGPTRIAVLPFETLAEDEQLAYLAAGLAEDTSILLARVDPENLRVVGVATRPPGSASATLWDLGRRLGVDLIVTSSLRRDGSRIRVTSRLLRVRDGEQVWSAAFDRELTNVLGLQRELGAAIAEQVRLSLSPSVAAAISRRQTDNPAAYALYLKGRYEWSQLTPDSTRRALDLYTQATTMDPSYGLAWAAKAFAAASSLRTVDADPAVAVPSARAALQRALQLSPDRVETQYARGYVALFCDFDYRAAAEAARAAIRLDPDNSQAHMLLGVTQAFLGQPTEAREMMRRARELDPLFALAYANSALVALTAGEPRAALDFATQSTAIAPELWVGHYYVGAARDRLGDWNGALEAYLAAARYSDGHSLTYRARVELLLRAGRTADALELLAEMEERSRRRYFPPYAIAAAHARLNERNAALQWLARAIERRDVSLAGLSRDPAFDGLREDPRFQDLLRRCGCPQRS